MRFTVWLAVVLNVMGVAAASAAPVVVTGDLTVCGMAVPVPASDPPPGSGPVVLAVVLCFDKQGGVSAVDPATYLHDIRLRPSEPSRQHWVSYDDESERIALEDFRRLWATNFLDDLSIEVEDYRFASGAIGKLVIYHLEERPRLKLVDYDGATAVSRADILDRLKEREIALRLDGFIDPSVLRRAAGIVRELYAEKGFQYAEVTTAIRALPGGPKLAHVVFTISEGPKVAIRDVTFVGNRVFNDRVLAKSLKANRAQSLLSLVSGRGTFSDDKFAEDAERVETFYRNHGYINARVEQPTLRVLDDSRDGATRWVQLRVAVAEGQQFAVGDIRFEGNTVIPTDALRPLFALQSGQPYEPARIVKALERAREIYGAGGYFEFTAYPDLVPRAGSPVPTVDVTIKITEGQQYSVNRITFVGNSQTRDHVIRREMGLVEGGVFNTEALKYSIRRLNQLGYFKPLDEQAVSVERRAGADPKVDVRIKVEEQNRNQLTFGAGASQDEGLFLNLAYTTANLLGRGESLTVSLQRGQRSTNYQLSFSEPFVLGRSMTAGGSVYSRKLDYALSTTTIDYSEVRSGFNLVSGVPVKRFTRLFATYAYEIVDTALTDDLRKALNAGSANPLLRDEGHFIESSITPSIVHNTVDNPFAPRSGRRLTASYQYAGGLLGGTSDFIKPEVEAIVYLPTSARTAFGFRANAGRIWNFGREPLAYYQRYALGGETQIRGVDVRTVGPQNESNVSLGGTSFVLFNAEYYFDILPQVRALAFHDAGQAFGEGQSINLRQLRTSSGAEVRVTLPVINVPFRLIYAWNIYRDSFQPARAVKFAVGTTF